MHFVEQRKIAAAAILSHLLRYNRGYTLEYLSDDNLRILCSKLSQETQWLVQSSVPPTSNSLALPLATGIQSLTLLCLIQWACDDDLVDIDQFLHSPTLVAHIVHFVFPSSVDESHTHRPQWTWTNNDPYSQSIALDLVRCWSVCNNDSWKSFIEQEALWENFVKRTWSDIISNEESEKGTNLPKLFFLHSSRRLQTERMLSKTIKCLEENTCFDADPYRTLFAMLCNMSKDVRICQVFFYNPCAFSSIVL